MVAKTGVVNRKRQPKGIPVGGEFASNEHDEAGSPLGSRAAAPVRFYTVPADEVTEELMREANALPGEDVRKIIKADGTEVAGKNRMTPKELLAEVHNSIGVYADRKNLSPDDREEASSRAIDDLLREARRKTGLKEGYLEVPGNLANHVARLQVKKSVHGGKKALVGDTGAAYGHYQGILEREESIGVFRSEQEKDDLAEEIRNNWHSSSHKPAEGFHRNVNRELSIDYLPSGNDDRGDYVHPALVDPYSPEHRALTNDEVIDRELDRLNGSAESKASVKADLRKRAWDVISGSTGAPPVRAQLPPAMRKTLSSVVASNGGVSALIDKFDRGDEDQTTEALFLPFRETKRGQDGRTMFGKITPSAKEEIIDVLRRNRSNADSLWKSAITSAVE